MERTACAGCEGPLQDFLNLGSSPLADRFPASPDEQEIWYPLVAAVCTRCWLVQLREIVPDNVLYSGDYGFRTGSSPSAVVYFRDLAVQLLSRYLQQARWLTVEIACNDGTLLHNFAKAGCPTIGVEPARGAAAEAAYKGIHISPYPFSRSLAKEILDDHGPAGLVLAFNVAAHVADPRDFLLGVHDLLADGGVAVIEFQNVADLIAGCQFDHVYHEHRFYYSLRSFSRLALDSGLSVIDWERSSAQGGSYRVFLTRQSGFIPADTEPWLAMITPYTGMQGRADYARRRLVTLILNEREQSRTIAGYGASAKSATLLNFCGIGPDLVPWIEDTTPGKIGRYTPGSRIPIRSRDGEPPWADTYLLTTWNYLPGVIRREQEFLSNGGRFIVPGPVPMVI